MEKEEKELLIELWLKIKNARDKLDISQSDLAEKTWIDRSYISMVERWKTNITYLKLKKLEKILDLDLN
jgi:ribosome-binding protein aMBF1 (putative translation factor)